MTGKKGFLFAVFLGFTLSPFASADNKNISFPQSCAKGQQVVIAAMGDLLLHQPLQAKASHQGFESLWREALPFIRKADIVYANLEGPIATGIDASGKEVADPMQFNFAVYSDFPRFNYHPSLAQDLKKSGFTLLSTANNHAFDRKAIGIDKTLDLLEKNGLMQIGSRKSNSQAEFYKIVEKNGLKIAWIACTEHTNGHEDTQKQILYCYKAKDKEWILNKIAALKSKVDAIIIAPHWGEEYQERSNQSQQTFAHQVLEAGATVVLGSHPHVLQEVEQYTTKDKRTTFISYSLGNFVSFQGSTRTRSSVILMLGLTKTAQGTIINGVKYVPMVMINRNGTSQIHLTQLTKQDRHLSAFGYISRAIPANLALYSPSHITNPECHL